MQATRLSPAPMGAAGRHLWTAIVPRALIMMYVQPVQVAFHKRPTQARKGFKVLYW